MKSCHRTLAVSAFTLTYNCVFTVLQEFSSFLSLWKLDKRSLTPDPQILYTITVSPLCIKDRKTSAIKPFMTAKPSPVSRNLAKTTKHHYHQNPPNLVRT